MTKSFVFFDFETTGLDSRTDRVIEIGAARFDMAGNVLAEFTTLVDSGVYPSEFVTQLTGITADEIRSTGVPPDEAFTKLEAFLGSEDTVAFNAEFDWGFRLAELRRLGISSDRELPLCALDFARRAWPVFLSHRLASLATFFGLTPQSHRALADCHLGARVFTYAAGAIGRNQIADRLELENLCVTGLDIDNLYSCSSGDTLALWTRPDFERINAYAPGSVGGSGLVVSFRKELNPWLTRQMIAGHVTALLVERNGDEHYEISPILEGAK